MHRNPGAAYALRCGLAVAIVFALWFGIALWAVPSLIGQAYKEQSFGFLNDVFSGRGQIAVGEYLAVWASLAQRITLGLLVASLLLAVPLLSPAALATPRPDRQSV